MIIHENYAAPASQTAPASPWRRWRRKRRRSRMASAGPGLAGRD